MDNITRTSTARNPQAVAEQNHLPSGPARYLPAFNVLGLDGADKLVAYHTANRIDGVLQNTVMLRAFRDDGSVSSIEMGALATLDLASDLAARVGYVLVRKEDVAKPAPSPEDAGYSFNPTGAWVVVLQAAGNDPNRKLPSGFIYPRNLTVGRIYPVLLTVGGTEVIKDDLGGLHTVRGLVERRYAALLA